MGRCYTCSRAFCRSHAAVDTYHRVDGWHSDMLTNECSACHSGRLTKEAARGQAVLDEMKQRQVDAWRRVEQLVAALKRAGSPGLEVRTFRVGWEHKRGLFRSKSIPIYGEAAPAYPVGAITWRVIYTSPEYGPTKSTSTLETGITESCELIVLTQHPGSRTGGIEPLEVN